MITGKIKPLKLLRTCKFLPLALLLCSAAPAVAQLVGDTAYATQTSILKSGHIPDSVFLHTGLVTLSVTGMDCDYGDHEHCWMLGEIPPAIGKLVNLRHLSLTIHAFTGLPAEMASLIRLEVLDLTDNVPLTDVTVVSRLTSLHTLHLYGCSINKLPNDIGRLQHLRELGLTGNPIPAAELNRIQKALPACRIVFSR